jgi:hypothetical protein
MRKVNIKHCLWSLLIAGVAAQLGMPVACGAESTPPAAASAKAAPGAIVGMVTNAAKLPVAGVTVTAAKQDGSAIRATVSGSDGLFSFADVPPGAWSLTVQATGYPEVDVPAVEVASSKATRHDIAMNIPGATPAPAAVPTSAVPESALVPMALQVPQATTGVDYETPFAYGDFTWLNGSPRNHQPVFDTKFFTPDIRFDAHYMFDQNHPQDHTIVGSTESFRSGEFQLEQVSLGGDFHWENVRARFLSMMGLFAVTTPRNDASAGVGQWDLRDAYRYLSEANAGYHFDVNHGLNVDAGIFVSYIGLFSYYNFDNWTYQPSYVSSNTPWFFNGLRIQWFPTNTLKIEPWIINGWQSYARFNTHLGFGGQILWMPNESLKLVFNNYGVGNDNLANTPGNQIANTTRYHTDDSILVRYYNNPGAKGLSKMAFSFTADAGCQSGGGLHCTSGPNKSAFVGWMLYNRFWFDNDRYAVTLGGGSMTNPGRYLTLLPPINGADAVSGSPYFTENPGDHAYQWDTTINFQYMPKEWITWWAEAGYRHSDVPYFAGTGGVTPPGGNNGSPQYYACNSGASAGTADLTQATAACGGSGGVWFPDLVKQELKFSAGVLVKF